MVNVFKGQVAVVLDGQYCDNANVSIRLDKMMDFYRVYCMIGVGWGVNVCVMAVYTIMTSLRNSAFYSSFCEIGVNNIIIYKNYHSF